MTGYSPCDWPVDYAACTGCGLLDDMSDAEREKFEAMAVDHLWTWTNRIFGLCEVTVRPCSSGCEGASRWTDTFWGRGPFPWQGSVDSGSWVPFLIGGQWYNMTCGCVSTCSCAVTGPTSIALPGPIYTVTRVRIDGIDLAPSSYKVAYNRYLVRTDGEVWPACQDLLANPEFAPVNVPGGNGSTFEVTYTRGVPVPVGGQLSAGVLAAEFAKAACNDDTCQLPARMKQIVRQDVTIDLMDDFKTLTEGGTGIWIVDNWVTTMRAPRPYSSVRSVDVKPKAAQYGY